MAFIVSLIIDAMKEDLTEALKTDDVAGATVVRRGPLQENPEKRRTSCLIYENDPEDIGGWLHEQVSTYELGGSGVYMRRFTVELEIFLTKQRQSRASAKEVFDTVHGRCIHALRNSTRLKGCQDEFGEETYLWRYGVDKSRMVLSGGDGKWVGRGKIWFTVYTQLP